MIDKRNAIEYIKCLDDIQFTEKIEGESVIGYIKDHDRVIQVSFLEDNQGKYLELSHTVENMNNAEKSAPYLSRWFVNGRYEINASSIRLFSIFPILDESYLLK